MNWESCQRQELLGVDITPVFRLTVQFLNGGLEECLFLSAWERILNEAQADKEVLRLLDDWLTGLLLYQIGLSKKWRREKLFEQAYVCWMGVSLAWARRIGQVAPSGSLEAMLAELRVLGCMHNGSSSRIKGLVVLAVAFPSLERLRVTIRREYDRVTRLLYPMLGYFNRVVDFCVFGMSLALLVTSLVLAYRFLVLHPILSLSSDVSKQSLKDSVLISYESIALVRNGVDVFGSRVIVWCVFLLWMVGMDSLSEWWIGKLLR